MLIPDPAMVQGKKSLIHLMILEILKENTDFEHHMLKEELRSKIAERYGFRPSRNNVYDKLDVLTEAGFPIVQDDEGVYYDGAELTDGELRFLADSVLYSDFASHQGAAEIIEALSSLGSVAFQKYMKNQIPRTKKTRKNMQKGVFFVLEEVQQAIFNKRQISCNYLTYTAELQTEKVYSCNIVINPYDLVYKNGKYYLLGALPEKQTILSWRVDRLCDVQILDTRRTDIALLKEIDASGGMSAYVDAQPDLCGGTIEAFKLQCYRDSLDDIVDAFGRDFRIAPEQNDNFDSETVILIVRTTREAMKAWAFANAGKIVVISPEDFRKDISESLKKAQKVYAVTGKPPHIRQLTADSFEEAIRFSGVNAGKRVIYHGNPRHNETIDLSLLAGFSDLHTLLISGCVLENIEIIEQLSMLRKLSIVRCQYSAEMLNVPVSLQELMTDSAAAARQICQKQTLKKLTMIDCDISDVSEIRACFSVQMFELFRCKKIVDCSALTGSAQIECLKIDNCPKIRDFSFLENMPNLKRLFIASEHFSLDDGIRLHERTGCVVYFRNERDIDDETLIKLGRKPKQERKSKDS